MRRNVGIFIVLVNRNSSAHTLKKRRKKWEKKKKEETTNSISIYATESTANAMKTAGMNGASVPYLPHKSQGGVVRATAHHSYVDSLFFSLALAAMCIFDRSKLRHKQSPKYNYSSAQSEFRVYWFYGKCNCRHGHSTLTRHWYWFCSDRIVCVCGKSLYLFLKIETHN